MPEPAELTAHNFKLTGLDRLEPHRNDRARNRILRDAHRRQSEIVNHVLERKLDDDRAILRHVQRSSNDKIVLGCRIGLIEAEWIRVRNKFDVAAPKSAIRSGQMEVPIKLLADGVDDDRVFI